MVLVLVATLKSLIQLPVRLLHAVRVIAAWLQPLLASKQAILSPSAQTDEFELLPFLALAINAIKIFVVMRLVVLLICLFFALIVLLISALALAAAPTNWALATSACLMNAVLRHVPVIRTSNASLALLFVLILMVSPAPGQLVRLQNAASRIVLNVLLTILALRTLVM